MFARFIGFLEKEIGDGNLDKGSLTQSLTIKLKSSMTATNPGNSSQDLENGVQKKEDEESDKKLGHIEIELEEIAQGVRENL